MNTDVNKKVEEAIFSFYTGADHDQIQDLLKDSIQDFEEYNKKKKQFIFLAKAKAKKKRNEYLLELASKFQQAIESNIEKPIVILKQFIQGNSSLALYRNLDKLSKEDIIEIIKDQNLIQLLEDLEKNESND